MLSIVGAVVQPCPHITVSLKWADAGYAPCVCLVCRLKQDRMGFHVEGVVFPANATVTPKLCLLVEKHLFCIFSRFKVHGVWLMVKVPKL